MSEAHLDEGQAGDSSASASDDYGDSSSQQVDNGSVTPTDASDQSEQGPIPYDRFKEVNSQKNEAQQNLGKMQEAFRQREAQWQQFAQGVQQQQTQQQTQEPASTEPDSEELYIKPFQPQDRQARRSVQRRDNERGKRLREQTDGLYPEYVSRI